MMPDMFTPLRKFFRRLTLTLLSAAMCLGLMQTAAQAVPMTETNYGDTTSPERLDQMKASRRKTQSEASQAAKVRAEAESASEDDALFGEKIIKKLNLDEIAEENVLVDRTSDKSEMEPSSLPPR